jgi:pimeloyl-ACP methyl ester carboxylesterase
MNQDAVVNIHISMGQLLYIYGLDYPSSWLGAAFVYLSAPCFIPTSGPDSRTSSDFRIAGPSFNMASRLFASLAFGLTLLGAARCQIAEPMTDVFNSTFQLSAAQKASLNLTDSMASNFDVTLEFEQTNWATGSVNHDPFYTDLPANASHAPAGSLLKLEVFTNLTTYTVAPTVALSRFIYQSKTLNGTLVPVSAYVLWPYHPRDGATAAPMVSWAHGTSGIYAECAPSHIRNLWYDYSGPFALALAGYAVVASDFAGLGVPNYPNGTKIVHQYDVAPSTGNDVLYAAEAALKAFPGKLTKEFVVMGHSQGGGAAWGAAQQQLKVKMPGYLGAIAISPVTNTISVGQGEESSIGLLLLAPAVQSLFPEAPLSSMLTPEGIKVFNVMTETQACYDTLVSLTEILYVYNPDTVLTQGSFVNTSYASGFSDLTTAGGQNFAPPLLVMQGTADTIVPAQVTEEYVNITCQKYPHNSLQFVKAEGVDHVPTMFATQQVWLDWLDERFAEAGIGGGCRKRISSKSCPGGTTHGSCCFQTIGNTASKPLDEYQGPEGYYLEFAPQQYEAIS